MNSVFQIWQSVQVINETHERAGQVGSVQSAKNADGGYAVKFDTDGQTVDVHESDLRGL